MKNELIISTHSKEETMKLGRSLAAFVKKGNVILLTGDLGAGKTTFTQGLAQGLGIKDRVISPTFNILKCYFNQKMNLYHIDAYRLESNNTDIGLEEFIEGDGVCVIEWPNYIVDLIPEGTLSVCITNVGDNDRNIEFSSDNPGYDEFFNSMRY